MSKQDIAARNAHGITVATSDYPDTFGNIVAKARAARGLSAAQLAAEVGIDEAEIAALERDHAEPNSTRLILSLSRALALDPRMLRAFAEINHLDRENLRILRGVRWRKTGP